MRQVITEIGKWIPLLFYSCNYRQAWRSAQLWVFLQRFVRSLLHILLYFMLGVIFAAVLISGTFVMWINFPETRPFWEIQIVTVGVIIALVPFRLTRYPSYILYSKIFRSKGLFFS